MRRLNSVWYVAAMTASVLSASAQDAPPPRPEARPPRPAAEGDRGARPAPRAPLSAEAARAAWELQAAAVAKRIGANDEQSKALVKAYVEARESHAKAAEKMRQELAAKPREEGAGRGAEAMKAMEDLNTAERAKFEKALGSSLSPEQTPKALASLGTFNRSWDGMVDTIAGMKLEPAKQDEALNAIEDYVGSQTKLRELGQSGDREVMRTAMQESRQKLTDALKKVLTEEQVKKLEESMAFGRGGMRGGPGGGGGGGG